MLTFVPSSTVAPASLRLPLRAALIALAALAAGCGGNPFVASDRSPPPVEVPEPGGHGTSRAVERPAGGMARRESSSGAVVTAAPSAARVQAAPDSALPVMGDPAVGGEPAIDGSGDIVPVGPVQESFDYPPVASGNGAVNALLAQADTERRSGNIDAAIAAAERAQRIAPADPAVYYQLAALRLQRGDHALAAQLARKGLSYRPDPELRDLLNQVLERAQQGAAG